MDPIQEAAAAIMDESSDVPHLDDGEIVALMAQIICVQSNYILNKIRKTKFDEKDYGADLHSLSKMLSVNLLRRYPAPQTPDTQESER